MKKINSTDLTIFVLVVILIGVFGFGFWNKNQITTFSESTKGLEEAKKSEIVELKDGESYNLTASLVKKTIGNAEMKMLAYNGSVPGPLLKVQQGSTITINFKNETDVPTTLHSHGIRLDNAYDGAPPVTQEEIPPGGSFVYKIKFPDAGIYWYHPHVREDYAQELGLYGNYLVNATSTDYWNKVNREIPIFLDDILIENSKIISFDKNKANYTLMGRFGNTYLINGEEKYNLQVKRNEVIRFYLTNSSNVRPYKFTIDGVKMKLVGGDSGTYEKDSWADSVTLGPSERSAVEVLFDKSGTFAIQNKTPEQIDQLGTITVSENSIPPSLSSSFNILKTHAETVESIDPFRPYFDKKTDKEVKLTIDLMGNMGSMMGGMNGMMGMEAPPDGIEWNDSSMMSQMNQMSNTDTVTWKIVDEQTKKENMDIDWNFKVGDKVKVRIINDEKSMHPMQHPIHFHGQRFLVINRNGIQQDNLVWKDTVLVPSGQYVDILLDASNPGTWMAHCHIAEHLEAGMMFNYKVEKE